MPKTIHLCDNESEGISIIWTKSNRSLRISGWYDSFVGIPGKTLSLKEFFDSLGITEKDCVRVFRD